MVNHGENVSSEREHLGYVTGTDNVWQVLKNVLIWFINEYIGQRGFIEGH